MPSREASPRERKRLRERQGGEQDANVAPDGELDKTSTKELAGILDGMQINTHGAHRGGGAVLGAASDIGGNLNGGGGAGFPA